MNRARFLLGLASVLAGTTVLLAVLGAVYNLFFLVLAVPFGVGTYLIWADATGRIEPRRRARHSRAERASRSKTAAGRADRRRARASHGRRVADGVGRGARRKRSRERRGAPTVDDGPAPEEARLVLGVAADADETEIKRAYRERAKEVHPDQAGGDEEAFKRATEAYERLVGE